MLTPASLRRKTELFYRLMGLRLRRYLNKSERHEGIGVYPSCSCEQILPHLLKRDERVGMNMS